MPKHYCDYCDVFLTHDSTSVRKAHNSGRNHLSNVRDYYASLGHDKAQNIIDQITQAYESGNGPPPGGFGFTAASLGAPPRTTVCACLPLFCMSLRLILWLHRNAPSWFRWSPVRLVIIS
ncbi:hypothetical protein BS47DRAFT_1291770 [Hydnum rufescens UP504]|uniref:Matrin-type domain-containing protein n=1 Tax=Hydnum rufescens UP504 TaxID=1448309 RepID=A0A9P6E0C3_9AGAM|nr:hypothetical protein BS47DRAFT_1291770 [Hydnum rufescens UP504]